MHSYTSAYDDKITHPTITKVAASERPYLNDYLINNLGISDGLEAVINDKMIIEWFMDGSTNEDDPLCRASNHFHDPTVELWQNAGRSDQNLLISGVNAYCSAEGLYPPENIVSNIFWATGYYYRPSSPSEEPFFTDNEWNWRNAELYYQIVLEPGTEADRNNYLAMTFEALGHAVHLLQDMSVPAHVRNDFTSHLIFQELDYSNRKKSVGNGFEHYLKKFSDIVDDAQSDQLDFTNWVVTDFWDTDGTTSTGLAEIINHNYFSASTIPSNNPSLEHQYDYPFIDNDDYQICEEMIPYPSDPPIKHKYISRKAKGACPPPEQMTTDHFANASLVNEDAEIIDQNISTLKLWLDDNVHDTYARETIPLAISYSEGLINYFFRGEIEATISGNELTIKNICDYTIGDGETELNLYWDDDQGNRNSGLNLLLKNGTNSTFGPLSKNDEAVFTFTPEPSATQYIVEYHGPIGNEYGVLGKIVHVSEFYLQVTCNGHTPTIPVTVKLIDNEGVEHQASSSSSEPDMVGPFEGVSFPATPYLYYRNKSNDFLFTFWASSLADDPDAKHFVATDEQCRRGGLHYLYARLMDGPGDINVKPVLWKIGEILESTPTGSIVFSDLKVLMRLHVHSKFFGFSTCESCDPDIKIINNEYIVTDITGGYPSGYYACKNINGSFGCGSDDICASYYGGETIGTKPDEINLQNTCIITDEYGDNPTYEDFILTTSWKAQGFTVGDCDATTFICTLGDEITPEWNKYEFYMTDTPIENF